MRLQLDRPVVFFDLETTGINILKDRIVEIALLKIFPDSTEENKVYRFNPGMPIPLEASRVHKIYDKDVVNEPKFADMAREIAMWFEGSDIAGFNSKKFDLPLLEKEMHKAGFKDFRISADRIIDVQVIYHKKNPRTLSAAYKQYLGRDLEDAHSAFADTKATFEVLEAMLEAHGDLPKTMEALVKFSTYEKDGHKILGKNEAGQTVFVVGKHRDKPVEDVEVSYLEYMISRDISDEEKAILEEVVNKRK